MTTKIILELHEHDIEVTSKLSNNPEFKEIIKKDEVATRTFFIYKDLDISFKELS